MDNCGKICEVPTDCPSGLFCWGTFNTCGDSNEPTDRIEEPIEDDNEPDDVTDAVSNDESNGESDSSYSEDSADEEDSTNSSEESDDWDWGFTWRCGSHYFEAAYGCGKPCSYSSDCASGSWCWATWDTGYCTDEDENRERKLSERKDGDLREINVGKDVALTQIESESDRRNLTVNTCDDEFCFNFSLFFFILLRCYGCPNDSTLLNDASRRMLMTQQMFRGRSMQQSGTCSADNKGPDRILFLSEYNEEFRSMREERSSEAVYDIEEVAEVQQHECDKSVTMMDTYLKVKVSGDYGYLTDGKSDYKEINVLQRAIKKAYNNLNMANLETCDLLFRRVRKVKFIKATSLTNGSFSMSFKIKYEARGTNAYHDLFHTTSTGGNNDHERHNYNMDYREEDAVEPECSCAVGAPLYRAPTKSEFINALKLIAGKRISQRKIRFINEVIGSDNDESSARSGSENINDSCVVCDNVRTPGMISKNKKCPKHRPTLKKKCKGTNWKNNGYCKLRCYNAGFAYSDDVCCNGRH